MSNPENAGDDRPPDDMEQNPNKCDCPNCSNFTIVGESCCWSCGDEGCNSEVAACTESDLSDEGGHASLWRVANDLREYEEAYRRPGGDPPISDVTQARKRLEAILAEWEGIDASGGSSDGTEHQDAPEIVLHPTDVSGPAEQSDDVEFVEKLLGEKYDVRVVDNVE